MAKYRVKDPQGFDHVIEGPDNATPDEVLAQAQQLIPSSSQETPHQSEINAQAVQPPTSNPVGMGTAFDVASELAPWNIARRNTTEIVGEKIAEGIGRGLPEYGIPGMPKTGAAIGTAIQMAPDILSSTQAPEAAASLRGPAENLGRRALGFNKGLIKRAGGIEKANKVARVMLDEGVITPMASPGTMLERAEDIGEQSGKRIGETLRSVESPATTTGALKREISSQLSPGRRGGVYDKTRSNINEVLETVGAHGKGPISFESAQELKQAIKGPAQFGKLTDGERAETFRKAYGIVRQAIDDGLDKAVSDGIIPAEKAAQFIKDKSVYGASEQAINALKDKLAGEAANNLVSLRGAAMGAAGVASGNPAMALEGLGVWELLRRRGEATGASALDYLSKTRGTNTLRTQIITQLVDGMMNRRNER